MDLTRSVVEATAAEYRREEPLAAVEDEHVEILPEMFATGEFGRRDAEWVVQWYYRRYLGAYPDAERRAAESRFGDNDFESVLQALTDAAATDDAIERLRTLTTLDGVDVPVGSAFLQFLDPETAVVVGDREWAVLRVAEHLSEPYPDPPSVDDYERYLGVCRTLCDRFDCDGVTLSRALWRLWHDLA